MIILNDDVVHSICACNIVAFLKMKCTCWWFHNLLFRNVYTFTLKKGYREATHVWSYYEWISRQHYSEELQVFINIPDNINIVWKTEADGHRQLKCSLCPASRMRRWRHATHQVHARDVQVPGRGDHLFRSDGNLRSREFIAYFARYGAHGALTHQTVGRCRIQHHGLHMTFAYHNTGLSKCLYGEDRIILDLSFSLADCGAIYNDMHFDRLQS